jgi:hypothetical protein
LQFRPLPLSKLIQFGQQHRPPYSTLKNGCQLTIKRFEGSQFFSNQKFDEHKKYLNILVPNQIQYPGTMSFNLPSQ